jgi:hypothetical protein
MRSSSSLHTIESVFRASWLVRAPVLLALVLWLTVGVIAAFESDGMPAHVFVAIAFFVVFFLIFVAYFFSMTYVVNEYGVVYRGATEFIHVEWDDILQVDNSMVPLGGYYVTTKRGGFPLNAMVRGHQELAELIIARAGLMPLRS